MNIHSIAPGRPFLDVLARWWINGAGKKPDPLAIADGLILLPTRRAARSLGEAFLHASGGKPLLLPRILAIGALDEAPLTLAGALDLPPAVDATKRLATLTLFVLRLGGSNGAPIFADSAWRLAAELAALLDEAHRSGVSLADKLPEAAEAAYAEHWQQTVRFLALVTKHWPDWLADNGLMDGAERAIRLLECQAEAWAASPPPGRVVVAGTSAGIPAIANLMRVAAGLKRGAVILPGLDHAMPDPIWETLDDGHPQAGLRALLAQMGATRGDVQPIEPPPATKRRPASPPGDGERRAPTVARALLPASALALWREPFGPVTQGLRRLLPADQQEEAVAVALALRQALERPGARAALVTPDRSLALRVAAELTRYGVIVDDSAGEPLGDTPPAAFLRLLARAAADGLAPVALLAVLKHPFAAFGLSPARCRSAARALERAILRGPAPPAGIAGLRAAMAQASKPRDDAIDLLDRLDARLAPLLALHAPDTRPADALAALIETAEAAAATDEEPGSARLWALEEGEALATHLAALTDALPILPPQRLLTLPGLLEAAMEGAVVRSRRALRGRDGTEHPRVSILGLLEARLQSFDLLVLGGLAETVWPATTDPGPWMSRPMRRAIGLTSPEERVGLMAHDFSMLACAAGTVVLSCPLRRDGAPAVPARWLVRLDAFLRGQDATRRLDTHPAALWATALDLPDGDPVPVAPPEPRPPLALRPRRLSVTEIGTWLRDPYAIFAKHILHLRALDPLEQNADAADYGTIVHAAVAAFVAALPPRYPADAEARLRTEMDRVLDGRALRPALGAWWRPRLHRIADFIAAAERDRRRLVAPVATATERKGEWAVADRNFTLRGVADRIDRLPDGTLAILDYKTGTVPSQKNVTNGFDSQLVLEAAMAEGGAFGPEFRGPATDLAYWRLTGGQPAGEISHIYKGKPDTIQSEVADAYARLEDLIRRYDDPAQPYLSEPHPDAKPRFSDYAQLARVAEWSAPEDEG